VIIIEISVISVPICPLPYRQIQPVSHGDRIGKQGKKVSQTYSPENVSASFKGVI
jgi:hypothetical protein